MCTYIAVYKYTYVHVFVGFLAACRLLDYKRFRKIADTVGAFLWCDMAHFSGFVAAGIFESPFDYCDVVTTTTHKTLRYVLFSP